MSHAPPESRRKFKKRTFLFGASLGAALVALFVAAMSVRGWSARPSATMRLPEQAAARGLAAPTMSSVSADALPVISTSDALKGGRPTGPYLVRPRASDAAGTVAGARPSAAPAATVQTPVAAPAPTTTVRVGANGAPIL